VVFGAHKGARVTSQTDAHVDETYLIRMALESLAARLALQDISDEAFAGLVKQIENQTEKLEAQIRVRNIAAALSANHEIHMTLYRAAGRPRLASMIENLWATYPFGAPGWPDERWDAMLVDHRRFLEVLRERDPNKMAAEMERHIGHARDMRLAQDALRRPASAMTSEATTV
jgi:DNA-binding GntR family transcriptional regulator